MLDEKNEILISEVFDSTFREYQKHPIHFGANSEESEKYLAISKNSYIRTLRDIVTFIELNLKDRNVNILEIGTFYGVVSVCLSKLGYSVTATDIPFFIQNSDLISKFESHQIETFVGDLRNLPLPVQDDTFSVIIMCEVIEHLNFNPLPLLQEINRILEHDGLFYLALPNIASLKNRKLLLAGRSIHNPIEHLILNLDPTSTMQVGLHWREYTMAEINSMLEFSGFRPDFQYYYDWFDHVKVLERSNSLSMSKALLKKCLYAIMPSLKEHQVTMARKVNSELRDVDI